MKLRRAVIELEVLYDADIEDPLTYGSLSQIVASTFDGHVSGDWDVKKVETVSKTRMAKLLIAQGSDPEFLLSEED